MVFQPIVKWVQQQYPLNCLEKLSGEIMLHSRDGSSGLSSEILTEGNYSFATFNGMAFHTDSMAYRGIDRVLPILEEEQVFMCHQMRITLKVSHLVLDVGTGCGVFAIYAARQNCRVVAIDTNGRALEMAKRNAEINGVRVCENPEELTNGSICFLQERFDRYFNRGLFDTVILAPPYNPTYPGIKIATHAQAGEDGQQCFNEQISFVPKMLKKGGLCIGNQMTTVRGKQLTFLKTISHSFEGFCEIRYSRILSNDIDSKYFLEHQYASQLNMMSVRDYIFNSINSYDQFALVYYEIKKTASMSEIVEFDHTQSLNSGWSERISLHRAIVDNI